MQLSSSCRSLAWVRLDHPKNCQNNVSHNVCEINERHEQTNINDKQIIVTEVSCVFCPVTTDHLSIFTKEGHNVTHLSKGLIAADNLSQLKFQRRF